MNDPIDLNKRRLEMETAALVRNLENLLAMAKRGEILSMAVGFEHSVHGAGKYWGFVNGNAYHLTGILDDVKLDILISMRENNKPIPLLDA